jgi:RNA polymerase sigma-70 factor (ECF subfamily)
VSDDDRETVRRVQDGETEAFEILVEKYKRKAFRIAYQVLRDQEDALDAAQEAFVKAFRALPSFKGDSAFYTWLFRITMNLALDRKRQRATRARSMGTDDVPPDEWERTAVSTDPDPEALASGAERRARIQKALDSLSENHRAIIILSDIEGLQYREIAEVLGIPMGTVMSRLHHARKRLRDALGASLAGLLAAAALLLGVAGPARAQFPPLPPPGALPPATATSSRQVCVYALVLFASNAPAIAGPGAPAVPGLAPPTPDPANPPAGGRPEAPEGPMACGAPVRIHLWVSRLRQVFHYSSYEPISAFETRVPVGTLQRFALPGGREMELQPLGIRPPIVRILVRVRRGGLGEIATVMDVPPRRPALIGGLPHDSGVLIIGIRSREE